MLGENRSLALGQSPQVSDVPWIRIGSLYEYIIGRVRIRIVEYPVEVARHGRGRDGSDSRYANSYL